MYPGTDEAIGLKLSSRTELGYVVGSLSGQLDIASTPLLREQLRGLLESSSKLVLDLSGVTSADASGLAVLVGTGHQAEALGGFLRLAAPQPAVAELLRSTGLDEKLEIFPTTQAALFR
jgi:anti-sigma B factor antagonist